MIAALLLSLLTQTGECKAGATCRAYSFQPPAIAFASLPTCQTSTRGRIMYDGTNNCMALCNGTAPWACVGSASGWTTDGTTTSTTQNVFVANNKTMTFGTGGPAISYAGPNWNFDWAGATRMTMAHGTGAMNFVVASMGISGPVTGNDVITTSSFTDDSATTGSRTVNKVCGINAFAAAATTITITNSFVTATSVMVCTIQTNDATATLKNCTPAAGSFTAITTAAATGITKLGWCVTKP